MSADILFFDAVSVSRFPFLKNLPPFSSLSSFVVLQKVSLFFKWIFIKGPQGFSSLASPPLLPFFFFSKVLGSCLAPARLFTLVPDESFLPGTP